MLRSLRGRLIILLLLLSAAALAAGTLMVDLFRQSATARAGQAEAEIGRACDAIAAAYRSASLGREGATRSGEEAIHGDLGAVVDSALRDRPGIEGGIWRSDTGSVAYAFPTYPGSGPKTDVPQAELARIQAVNRAALAADRQTTNRYDASSQILFLTACPLGGSVSGLTAWTMTRVVTSAGSGYRQLMAGLGILLATVIVATMLLMRLTMTWSRHIGTIETTLQSYDVAELPVLPVTGERELDRIVRALNEAGRRLAEARRRADQLARQVTTAERLAAIGRIAAGVAHEIRNPIAAMRLKAENAVAGDSKRKDQALATILGQIERLDALLRRLLSVTEPEKPHPVCVALQPFLTSCAVAHSELARARGVTLACRTDVEASRFDPEQMRRALDNLILNAVQAAPAGTGILIAARRDADRLVLSVHDQGCGPPAPIREHLFEPFVTGRADGTGLGLSIVREIAGAHGGTARLGDSPQGTLFEILVPWRPS
jgi:signal transduction histidine kinase